MKLLKIADNERDIETHPGYLGVTCDGDLLAEPALHPLHEFDFVRYSALVDAHGATRQLKLMLATGAVIIEFNAYDDVARILDQLPTIDVYLDQGPPDAGLGIIQVFFIAQEVTDVDLKASVAALAAALRSDFRALEVTG